MIIVGVFGTTISPYCFFWQASQEVEEKRAHGYGKGILGSLLTDVRRDTTIGMVLSEVATWFIIETTAVVLYANGIRDITTSAQAASALEPLVKSFAHAGKISEILFALGVIGTGALAVPIFAASSSYAVCELFEWKEGLALKPRQAPGFYWTMVAGIVMGVLKLRRNEPNQAIDLCGRYQRCGRRTHYFHADSDFQQQEDYGKVHEWKAQQPIQWHDVCGYGVGGGTHALCFHRKVRQPPRGMWSGAREPEPCVGPVSCSSNIDPAHYLPVTAVRPKISAANARNAITTIRISDATQYTHHTCRMCASILVR